MANQKNKGNKKNHFHRHVFVKRRVCTKVRKARTPITNTTNKATTSIETQERVKLDGSRIVNLEKLQQYTDRLVQHSVHCDGSVVLCGESRDGLASIFTAKCDTCGMSFNFDTSKKVEGPRGYSR